ncbi:MAG: toll/interleukin-1 receptor domain-containing protein [Daejeonella sp.]|uniref:toll/interleukin-1 receptor domain-containing protein n=1 Tax=Daejeonella sp. TaxID=2805397 RepID=UPI00273607D6|nr:toll/interleukin-1 receptor domain-containing protein [Daejeonella sp.]MDP3466724.1 toll/interleukin-1 receptor domain-containing protein [Daejeonella sp.]
MQFPTDIFISYAHIDDESLIQNQKGWISEFHRALDIRLAQLLGRRPVIWRDDSLQGNHVFDKQIVDQFAKVAIMISIITPRYVKSEWCIREVDEFYNTSQTNIGFTVSNKARIFKVIKTPVRIEQHPEKISGVLGYEFYNTDPGTGRVKELSQAFGNETERLYWEKLDDLAHDISSFLESLELPLAATSSNQSPITANGQSADKVFLAESSYDTQDFRDSLKRELQGYGYHILPDKQLPLIAKPLNESLISNLSEAVLSIHLLGENYGVVPEGAQKSIVEIQNDVAASYSAANSIPRFIWIPEGCEPGDDRQISFIDKLNSGKEGIAGADLVQGSLEDFKSVVIDKLNSMKKEVKKEEEQPEIYDESSKIIYLICDLSDIDEIRPLEDFLFDNGYEVVIPIFEGDESGIREDHIENLKTCSAAIIFFSNANELWLRSKTRDFLKINGYGRAKPLAFKAIYIAPPDSMSKQRFRTLDAEVINALNGLPEEKLKSLLSKI